MKVYALKGILPKENTYVYPFQENKLFKKDGCVEEQTKYCSYALKQLENNSFYQSDNEHFYIIKVKSENLESIGLIARLNVYEIANKLHLHEKTTAIKVQKYVDDLLKHNILTSPLIISHDSSNTIDEYLRSEAEDSNHAEVVNIPNKYKVWRVKNNQEIINLFAKEVDQLFLADGHHRLEALKKTNKKFFYAYLVSNQYLKSRNIYRVYESIDKTKINKLIQTLQKYYSIKKYAESLNYTQLLLDTPALIYNNEVFLFNSNAQDLDFFLELIYKDLSNGTINFINYNQFPDIEKIYRKLCVFIPKININSLIAKGNIRLPTHSSYFEPKIPDGLLSMSL